MFKNMKLAVKIGSAFAVVLILTSIVGFVGWSGMNGAHRRVLITEGVYEIEMYMLEIRQHEKNYIMRGDSEYIENVAHLVEEVKEHSGEIEVKLKDAADKGRLDGILAAINEYEKAFNLYVDLHEQDKLAEDEMVTTARVVLSQAEEILKEQKADYIKLLEANAADSLLDDKLTKRANANQIIKWILECREHEKNYQLRHDLEYKEQVDTIAADIIDLSKDMKSRFHQTHNLEQTDLLITESQAYLTAFDEFVDIDEHQYKAEEEMVQAARKASELVIETLAGQKIKLEQEITKATLIIISCALMAVIFGVLVAFIITVGVLKQLGSEPDVISDIATKISEGDLMNLFINLAYLFGFLFKH